MTIHIGVDLDNVIAEMSLYVAQLVAEHHIPGFTVDHHTSWHLTDCTGLTHEQQESLYDDLHANLDKLIPVPGAQATLDKLTRDGHYIHILTHRPYDTGVATPPKLPPPPPGINIVFIKMKGGNHPFFFFP